MPMLLLCIWSVITPGFAETVTDSLASGVLGAPLTVNGVSMQVISVPEYTELRLPGTPTEDSGKNMGISMGKLSPRDLVVVQNGSCSVMSLTQPEPDFIDLIRGGLKRVADLEIPYSSEVASQTSDDPVFSGHEARNRLKKISAWVRSKIESRIGPVTRSRLKVWVLSSLVLTYLFLGLIFSGLIWRSAAAICERPWLSLILGAVSGAGIICLMALFIHSRIGIPFLILPLAVMMPLLLILPAIASGALVVLTFNPQRVLGGILGLCLIFPLLVFLFLAGRTGFIVFILIELWALGGILLSRIPGTGRNSETKEETHVEKSVDSASG
ncbi:MAG: hypothetical protein HQM09_23385 [Candidatus Riflebacteria bacterium]|nr:hypothetical protein [Candidatus Riflebacteria bacterium]